MSRSPRRQLDASEVADWTTAEALTDSLTDRGFTEIAGNEDHPCSDVLAIEGEFEHVHTLKMGENSYVPIFDLESSKPPNVSSDLDESIRMVITIHESEIFSFISSKSHFAEIPVTDTASFVSASARHPVKISAGDSGTSQ